MRNDDNVADITFDISNNKVLANMDVNGAIKNLTIFRDTYRANEKSETPDFPLLIKRTMGMNPASYPTTTTMESR